MEILIGTSIVFAFVLLGALISLGNERQRRAIDALRDQAEAWAEQDIRIKREKLARQVTVTEPLVWLEKTVSSLHGQAPGILSTSLWEKDGVQAMIALCKNGDRLVFTTVPRERFLKAIQLSKRSALVQAEGKLLGDRPNNAAWHELSVVSSGMFFDIEAAQVWLALSGQNLPVQRLTMFEVPSRQTGR